MGNIVDFSSMNVTSVILVIVVVIGYFVILGLKKRR